MRRMTWVLGAMLIAMITAPLHAADKAATGSTLTATDVFAVKSVTFTGDQDAGRLAYLQSFIEGELLKNGMIVKSDGVTIEATARWDEGTPLTKNRSLQLMARALRDGKLSYSIAVTGGGQHVLLGPTPRMAEDKTIIEDAATKFVIELKKQVTAQRQAMQLVANQPRTVRTSAGTTQKK